MFRVPKKARWRLGFFVSHVRHPLKKNVRAICRSRNQNRLATDTEFVTVAKPGLKTNQFWKQL